MKKFKFMSILLCFAMVVSGCGTSTQNGALIGAGGGAALGAVVGKIIGKKNSTLIGAAVGTAVGTTAGVLIGKKMDKAKAAAAQVANAEVSTVTDANGLEAVKVSFDNGILFATGKSNLQSGAMTSLRDFATKVLNVYTDCDVDIHGYASSDGSEETNMTLSQNRANAVRNYLINNCGVSTSQIQNTQGYGEDPNYLVYNADGTENRAASRRVEVYLYASEAMINAANDGTLQ
ncbi:MAG: OmpA family protein [Bacteroidaceae bacterium]|nr:OmpA family protein [Bacteroidaceae bacterium]